MLDIHGTKDVLAQIDASPQSLETELVQQGVLGVPLTCKRLERMGLPMQNGWELLGLSKTLRGSNLKSQRSLGFAKPKLLLSKEKKP